MFINFEYLFILSLAGLYLYDSATVCFYNNVFTLKGIKNKFDYQLPHSQFNFGKKFLVFLQLLSPHVLVFKSTWQYKHIHQKMVDSEINHIHITTKILKNLQPIIILLFILTFIILPTFILLKFKTIFIIFTILSIYIINILLFIFILKKRKNLNISKKLTFQLLLDAVFCPPFALNTLKKISLNISITSDSFFLNKSLLTRSKHNQFTTELIKKIENIQSQHESHDSDYILLENRKNDLINKQKKH